LVSRTLAGSASKDMARTSLHMVVHTLLVGLMADTVRQQVDSLAATGSAIEDHLDKDSGDIFLSVVLQITPKVERLVSVYSTVIIICNGKTPHTESGQSLLKRHTSEFFAYFLAAYGARVFFAGKNRRQESLYATNLAYACASNDKA